MQQKRKTISQVVPYIGTLITEILKVSDDIEAFEMSASLRLHGGFEQIEISLPDEDGFLTVTAMKIIPTPKE